MCELSHHGYPWLALARDLWLSRICVKHRRSWEHLRVLLQKQSGLQIHGKIKGSLQISARNSNCRTQNCDPTILKIQHSPKTLQRQPLNGDFHEKKTLRPDLFSASQTHHGLLSGLWTFQNAAACKSQRIESTQLRLLKFKAS
eukprot:s3524_g2.t1